MGRLTPIAYRDLIEKLRGLGFEGPFAGGKHPIMVRRSVRLTVPNPHGQAIGVELPARVLRQTGVSRDEWESVE